MDYGVMRRDRSVQGISGYDWRQAERRQAQERGHKEGVAEERDRMRREAIKAGVGEYVIVDPMSGRTEFRWKQSSQ